MVQLDPMCIEGEEIGEGIQGRTQKKCTDNPLYRLRY